MSNVSRIKPLRQSGRQLRLTVSNWVVTLLIAEMAPFARTLSLPPPRSDTLETIDAKNAATLEEFDSKVAKALETDGESEISALLRGKAMYLCRIGDKVDSCYESS